MLSLAKSFSRCSFPFVTPYETANSKKKGKAREVAISSAANGGT
jgi:hypothetical protein